MVWVGVPGFRPRLCTISQRFLVLLGVVPVPIFHRSFLISAGGGPMSFLVLLAGVAGQVVHNILGVYCLTSLRGGNNDHLPWVVFWYKGPIGITCVLSANLVIQWVQKMVGLPPIILGADDLFLLYMLLSSWGNRDNGGYRRVRSGGCTSLTTVTLRWRRSQHRPMWIVGFVTPITMPYKGVGSDNNLFRPDC